MRPCSMRRRAHARCAGGALQSASLGCEPNFNQKKHKALEQILGGPWAVRVAWAHQSPSDPCCDSYLHGAGAHDPQAVVEPERVLDGVAFVLCSDLCRARQGDPDGQRVLLACVGGTLARTSAQLAPRGLLSAPAHATGCTEPRAASASRGHAASGRMDAEAAQRPPATPAPQRPPRPSCLGPPLHRAACALGEDAHSRALENVVHLAASGGQPRRHDVGARQDEADRAAVHLELGQDVREPATGWLR